VILIVKELDRRLGMTIKKLILLILFWLLIIFSATAQISDIFIQWLSPNAVSLIDERMSYTFGPVLINFIVVFLLWKIKTRKNLLLFLLLCNAGFFLYYIYYQFGDMGLGRFR
jgi:sugar phosphate permease